jgi:hypothetical protein
MIALLIPLVERINEVGRVTYWIMMAWYSFSMIITDAELARVECSLRRLTLPCWISSEAAAVIITC